MVHPLEQILNAPNGKAFGLDGILNEAIKIKGKKCRILSSLNKIFNHILKICLFSKTWRVDIVQGRCQIDSR